MITTYINNVPSESGEITVLMHHNAEVISHHACQTAQIIRQEGIGVLLLNCATSSQRFDRIANKYITDDSRDRRPHLFTRTMERGNLAEDRNYVDDMLSYGISVIIISGWEWTSHNYRRKKQLLHILREWAERQKAAIIIYSQSRTEPTVGEYDRGGLGWLASIAFAIAKIDSAEQTANILKPKPLISTEENVAGMERSVQLFRDLLKSYDTSDPNGEVPPWPEGQEHTIDYSEGSRSA